MNHYLKTLVVAFLLSTQLFAKIIESKKMSDILREVTADSLVIFDLDNTIMEAAQSLGSDQWFEHRIKQQTKKGLSIEDAVKLTSEEWEAINHRGKVQLVDPQTPAIVRHLHYRNIPTMGLTARPATFMDESLRQLRSLNAPLYQNTISEEILTFKDKDVAIFKEGLMSVGSNNKGTILIALFNKIKFYPGRVIFVDDKVKNVTHVDTALNEASIPSFAFRYGATDEKVAAFDAKLADFEFEYFRKFGVVLSDCQARKLMN